MMATPLSSFSTAWKNLVVLLELLSTGESGSSAGSADAKPRDAAGALVTGGLAPTARLPPGERTKGRLCSIAATGALVLRLARVDEARADRAVEVPRAAKSHPCCRVCSLQQ